MTKRALGLPSWQRNALKAYRFMKGRRILDCVETLEKTQWLPVDELRSLQREKLLRLLEHAYGSVPYYRKVFDDIGLTPQAIDRDFCRFLRIPLLSKAQLRHGSRALVTTDPDRRRGMRVNSSSGSTGVPVTFYQGNNYWDHAIADMYRYLSWCGWRFGEPHAYIMGSAPDPSWRSFLKARVTDWIMNSFRVDAFGLSEMRMAQFAERIVRRKPAVLIGYASALTVFADFVQKRELDEISFAAVQSTSEIMYPSQRALIEGAFRCHVFDRYGCREVGDIAHECEQHRGYHVGIESNYVEIVKDDQPVKPGEKGEIVVTNLNNYTMPLIRYCTGDVGVSSEAQCQCGRGLPLIGLVEGRLVDPIRLPSGRSILPSVLVVKIGKISGIGQFQIVQETLKRIAVRIIPGTGFSCTTLVEVEACCNRIVTQEAQITVEVVESLPLEPSGKFRVVKSKVRQDLW